MKYLEHVRTRAVVVLLAAILAAPAFANPSTRAVAADDITIDNFGRISATYYRGSQPVGRDYSDLAALGVKTVINLIGDEDDVDPRERASVEQHGMRYVHIPMNTRIAPTGQQIEQFLAIVNSAEHQPVYVHCVGGKHRTGVMTAVYRMTVDGYSSDQAFDEMKDYKYGWDFLHPEFKKFVYRYEPKTAAAAAATQQ